MKRSQLEAIIREALSEVLNEEDINIINVDTQDPNKKKIIQQLNKDNKSYKIVPEGDIDEMANVAIRYQLSPDANAADFTGKKNRILAAMQANGEPMSKIDVAGELGYDKQNPINADFMALVASGAIIPAGEQRAPRFSRPQP
jgi:hypothetical protein